MKKCLLVRFLTGMRLNSFLLAYLGEILLQIKNSTNNSIAYWFSINMEYKILLQNPTKSTRSTVWKRSYLVENSKIWLKRWYSIWKILSKISHNHGDSDLLNFSFNKLFNLLKMIKMPTLDCSFRRPHVSMNKIHIRCALKYYNPSWTQMFLNRWIQTQMFPKRKRSTMSYSKSQKSFYVQSPKN